MSLSPISNGVYQIQVQVADPFDAYSTLDATLLYPSPGGADSFIVADYTNSSSPGALVYPYSSSVY